MRERGQSEPERWKPLVCHLPCMNANVFRESEKEEKEGLFEQTQ